MLPVDGSEVSNHAAKQGLMLAKALGSKVIFHYVIDISIVTLPDAEMGISNLDVIRKSFTEQGNKVIAAFSASAREMGVGFDAVVTEGDVHDEIISLAADKGAELIVMGTHGRRGLNRLLLGSVAASVTKRAHCPVLLIRPD
jgi:nucleotide-binding universal stress UspA family protein